jgi:hypothetical protein
MLQRAGRALEQTSRLVEQQDARGPAVGVEADDKSILLWLDS